MATTRGQQKKSNATLSKAELTKLEKEAEKRSEARKESKRRGRASAVKNREAGNAGLSSKRLNRMEAEAERKSAEKRNRKPMTDDQKRMVKRIASEQSQRAQNKGDAKLRTEDRTARRGPSKSGVESAIKTATDKARSSIAEVTSRVGRGAKALTGLGAALTPSEIGVGQGESRSMAEERATATAQANANRLRTQMDAAKASDKRKAQDKISEASKSTISAPKTGRMEGEPRSIAEAKRMGKDYFIGRDGKRKAAVTAEELKASGMSLRDYLNKQKGKTARMAKGGMANCGASMPPAQKSSKGNK
jgi:hypothetical protein